MSKKIRSLISTIIFLAIAWSAIYYFFGVTSVTAEFEGKPIECQVMIDSVKVGNTPYSERLGFGFFEIRVVPPTGYHPTKIWYHTSLVVGNDIHEELVAKRWRASLSHAESAEFEIIDEEKKSIGTCDGDECEIPLPGPGTYQANMKSCTADGKCVTGVYTFTLDASGEEVRLNW